MNESTFSCFAPAVLEEVDSLNDTAPLRLLISPAFTHHGGIFLRQLSDCRCRPAKYHFI